MLLGQAYFSFPIAANREGIAYSKNITLATPKVSAKRLAVLESHYLFVKNPLNPDEILMYN
jgi:hypothetical protein